MKKIYSSCTKRPKNRQISSLGRVESKQGKVSAKKINNIRQNSNFFDLEYLFTQPQPAKKNVNKRLQVTKKDNQTVAVSQSSICPKKDDDPMTKDRPKNHNNNSFFGLSSIGSSQNRRCQRLDLSFAFNSQFQSIHHRKYHCKNHPISQKNTLRQTHQTIYVDELPLQQCLTTRSFVNETQRLTISQQKKYQQPIRKTKKVEEKIANIGLQTLMLNRRKQWLESEQFKKYYSKQVQNARRAFIDKNKQTIKIYRPWSPTSFQFEQAQNAHF